MSWTIEDAYEAGAEAWLAGDMASSAPDFGDAALAASWRAGWHEATEPGLSPESR